MSISDIEGLVLDTGEIVSWDAIKYSYLSLLLGQIFNTLKLKIKSVIERKKLK